MIGQLNVAVESGTNIGFTSSALTNGSSAHPLLSFISFFSGEELWQAKEISRTVNAETNRIQKSLISFKDN
jgi:hypothetical protein